VAEAQEIHQIEYRWQPAKDMSAVASSMSPESFRSWVQRIGPWVRHPSVDAPTGSVRYEIFGDRAAALAWRQRDRQVVEFEEGREGRPLVSRVLLGPADLLTPEVAVALSYTGLPMTIGPRPGTVTAGTPLPPIHAARLAGLVRDNAEVLDRAAAQEPGLERVVAAALGDRDTPLSVQLPERIIVQSPRGGAQARLLWGLRRMVWPLVGRGGRRGWSFSTFELPLNDMDPETLPDIVFRLSQAAPQAAPMMTRREIRIRPQDPAHLPADTLYENLARLLVTAYRDHGGDELSRMIAAHAGDLASTDRRIQAVYNALDASLPAVTVISRGPGDAPALVPAKTAPDDGARADRAVSPPSAPSQAAPSAVPDRARQESAAYSGEVSQPVPSAATEAAPARPATPAVPAERDQPEPSRLPPVYPPPPADLPSPVPSRPPVAAPPTPTPSAAAQPAAAQAMPTQATPTQSMPTQAMPIRPVATSPGAGRPSLPVPPPLTSKPPASSSRSPLDAPQLFGGESRREQAEETRPPATLGALLTLLSAGPASNGFQSTIQTLSARNFQSGPQDRAAARKLISDHGWFVDVFRQYDQAEFEGILVMIFWQTVIPDLGERRVAGELADWAGKLAAPTAVIRALYTATEGAPDTQQMMDHALRSALGWRWLNEHAIRPPVAASQRPRDTETGPWDPDAESGTHGVAAHHAVTPPSDGPQILQNLLDRKVTMPVSLVLAICVAVIVLLVIRPH
jgi:hypothetical protein